MSEEVPARHPWCAFGPFRLDLGAGELHKDGRRIRLQEQPFQILRMLLEWPGEVLPREDIRKRLWPDDTVVEFDQSINAAVNRLRIALRDSAEKPRYIETVARRGYRFISPVRTSVSQLAASPAVAAPVSAALAPSVAVLPFASIGTEDNKDDEYFSDGLAEEIINRLTRTSGLKTIARTSAFAFKGKQQDIRKIATALKVSNILEGSVRRAGGRLRILARLITAVDGSTLWSGCYDREMMDVFEIQDEIAQAIASALRVELVGMPDQYTPRLASYEAYLRARHYMAAMTRESLARSKQSYEQAIALDADFAPAHSGLAILFLSAVLPGILFGREALPLARSAAQRALELDPESQEAQAVLGTVAALYDFDWRKAENLFRMALAREPVPPYVRWYYAYSYLFPMGRFSESSEQCLSGLKDDPLSFIGGFHYAGTLLGAGMEEAGETQLRELCELHPNLYQPFYLLGLSHALRGLHSEALRSAETAYALAPWNTGTTGLLAGALHAAGKTDAGGAIVQKLLPGDRAGTPMGLLLFHLVSGELHRAAEWGWKVREQRDTRLIYVLGLLRAPSRNILRCDVRWSELARSLNIPL